MPRFTSKSSPATAKAAPAPAPREALVSGGSYHYARRPMQRRAAPPTDTSYATAAPVNLPSGAVVQRQIGDGEWLLNGRMVVHVSGKKFEIVGHETFLGRLYYKLEDSGGSTHLARADDDNYNLFTGYEGVFGFEGREQSRTSIEFTVYRRDGGPRTRTQFADPAAAVEILVNQCDVPRADAEDLITKSDWSYPVVRRLMRLLEQESLLQPGLSEGARLWEEAQPDRVYTIRTTGVGSQLAQLVGCHLMEYQETNNGTQGPRQSKHESRQTQLEFTRAILSLPEYQVATHAIGLGQPPHLSQFPAPFDIKFEGGPLFGRNAGTSTFKIYQSSLAARDQGFDYTDTLDDDARRERRTTTRAALASTSFNADTKDIPGLEDDDFIQSQFGLKDTESDHSMDEDEEWEPPLTTTTVSSWTLEQLYEFIYKHNVYSGVLFKEYAAKQAELDILETKPHGTFDRDALLASRYRRRRVQLRIAKADDALLDTLRRLDIPDAGSVTRRLLQWRKKTQMVAAKTSRRARRYQEALRLYGQKSLLTLRSEGYPPPLNGIGDETLKHC